ncbi:MAG: hypothetical protein IT269_08095 [Saprospiraceae bacterium]|nr:hypothetical protein [Saprospiraceae bacterium]
MLNKFLLIIAFLMTVAPGFAQRGQVVIETERAMSFGTRPCFRMEFDGAKEGLVEETWRDFAKKRFKAKLKKDKKSDEWTATQLTDGIMGNDEFAIYSTIEKTSRGAALNVWIDAGANFLNRRDNAGRTEEMARTLRDCYYDVRRAIINGELKAQEDKIKDMEKKQRNMQKDTDGLRKDIETWTQKIKKAEQDIVTNEKAMEANLIDIENQRRAKEEIARRLENVENEGN